MGRVAIGKIKKSHGVKGFFRVYSFSGESRHFTALKEVYLLLNGRYTRYRVDTVQTDSTGVRLKLEGIDTPEQVKKLIGTEIWVEDEWACPLNEGEYYASNLHDCRVHQSGIEIGRVSGLVEGNGEVFLEVPSKTGKSLLIPFKEVFISDVDIDEGTITLTGEYIID